MGYRKWGMVGIIVGLIFLLCGTAFAEMEMEEESEGQEFLFLNEPAYLQEKGAWEVALAVGYFDNLKIDEEEGTITNDQWESYLEVEYGITDRLQISAEIPYISYDADLEIEGEVVESLSESGFGDLEFGLSYALVQENESLPAISVGLFAIAPTGDEDKGLGSGEWGFEVGLALSKSLSEKLYGHVNLSYGQVNGIAGEAGEEGEEFDETEFEYGVALAYALSEELEMILEFRGEYEKEEGGGESESMNALYIAPGIAYEFENDLTVGIDVVVGLNDDSYDFGSIVKLTYEF